MGGVADQIAEMLRRVFELEGGTFGGKTNLSLLIIIVIAIVPLSALKLAAEIIRAFVAKWVGDPNPARFMLEPTPTRKLIITLLLFFVGSLFTVWFVEYFRPPFEVPKKPAVKQEKQTPREK